MCDESDRSDNDQIAQHWQSADDCDSHTSSTSDDIAPNIDGDHESKLFSDVDFVYESPIDTAESTTRDNMLRSADVVDCSRHSAAQPASTAREQRSLKHSPVAASRGPRPSLLSSILCGGSGVGAGLTGEYTPPADRVRAHQHTTPQRRDVTAFASLESSPRSTSGGESESSPGGLTSALLPTSPSTARHCVTSHIDRLIEENSSRVDGVTSWSQRSSPASQREQAQESLKRIDELLAKNESIAQSEADLRRLQEQHSSKTKPTLSDKISEVKSQLKRDRHNAKRKLQCINADKRQAISKIERLIQENERQVSSVLQPEVVRNDVVGNDSKTAKLIKNISHREQQLVLQSDVSSGSQSADDLQGSQMSNSSAQNFSYSQGSSEGDVGSQRVVLAAANDTTIVQKRRKVATDDATIISPSHLVKQADDINATAPPDGDINPLLFLAQVTENESKLRRSSPPQITSSEPPSQQLSAAGVYCETIVQDRAIIQDHTYEEDKVNTQQFSIQRDHTYRKLRKNRKYRQPSDDSRKIDTVDHTYYPKPE